MVKYPGRRRCAVIENPRLRAQSTSNPSEVVFLPRGSCALCLHMQGRNPTGTSCGVGRMDFRNIRCSTGTEMLS